MSDDQLRMVKDRFNSLEAKLDFLLGEIDAKIETLQFQLDAAIEIHERLAAVETLAALRTGD